MIKKILTILFCSLLMHTFALSAASAAAVAPATVFHSLERKIPNFWKIAWMNKGDGEKYYNANKKKPYDFDGQVKKLLALRAEEKNVSLILGRSTSEGLKGDHEEVGYRKRPNHVWAFACNDMMPSTEHPHFLMNFAELSMLRLLPDNIFSEIIFDNGVVEWLINPNISLREVFIEYHRILKPGGSINFSRTFPREVSYDDGGKLSKESVVTFDETMFLPHLICKLSTKDMTDTGRDTLFAEIETLVVGQGRGNIFQCMDAYDRSCIPKQEEDDFTRWGWTREFNVNDEMPAPAQALYGAFIKGWITEPATLERLTAACQRHVEHPTPSIAQVLEHEAEARLLEHVKANLETIFTRVEIRDGRSDGNDVTGTYIFAFK